MGRPTLRLQVPATRLMQPLIVPPVPLVLPPLRHRFQSLELLRTAKASPRTITAPLVTQRLRTRQSPRAHSLVLHQLRRQPILSLLVLRIASPRTLVPVPWPTPERASARRITTVPQWTPAAAVPVPQPLVAPRVRSVVLPLRVTRLLVPVLRIASPQMQTLVPWPTPERASAPPTTTVPRWTPAAAVLVPQPLVAPRAQLVRLLRLVLQHRQAVRRRHRHRHHLRHRHRLAPEP